MSTDIGSLLSLPPGTPLDKRQSATLAQWLGSSIETIARRRRNTLLVHSSLQNTVGQFLALAGLLVAYEVPFETGGYTSRRSVFDIVAEVGERHLVIEVKDTVTPRDLGQVQGYIHSLRTAKSNTDVYLATDILNYAALLSEPLGNSIKELMDREAMGVILADKYLLLICGDHAQLTLGEMPELFISDKRIG